MDEHIYYGPWINWAHGPILGANLTLGDRSGGLLTAFIATFVTVVGVQLFRIITYGFHQYRSEESAQDGLYHQQQVIFRNTSTPGTAAWSFLVQAWVWNGKARIVLMRTVPWAFFCLSYMIMFAVAAVFSSDISKTPGTARLIIGDTCGYWATQDDTYTKDAVKAYSQRLANNSVLTAAYATSCYGSNYDELSCSKFIRPYLKTTHETDAACPFDDKMCLTSAYKLTSQKIDSLYDLGINSRHADRLEFQKIVTCAPIETVGYTELLPGNLRNGLEGDTIYDFMYGPDVMRGTSLNLTDYTYMYNNHTVLDDVGYKLAVSYRTAAYAVENGGWMPIDELNRTDADVTLLFLSANGISYADPIDDPVFAANIPKSFDALLEGVDYYVADNYVTVMGCADQYQICNPANGQCTGAIGLNQLLPYIAFNNDKLDLNIIQQAIATRLTLTASESSINGVSIAQAENGLRAKEQLIGTISSGLPSNQWQIEIANFFNKGLAHLQIFTVEYATGPTNVVPGSYVYQPWANDASAIDLVAKAMCYSQMVNDSSDTVSFSILGLIVLFAVGGVIVIVSLFIDMIIGWIQIKTNRGTHARMCWLLDDKLQLHRYLNQELGHGQWSQDIESVPYTISPHPFHSLAKAHERIVPGEKTPPYSSQGTSYGDSGYAQEITEEHHHVPK